MRGRIISFCRFLVGPGLLSWNSTVALSQNPGVIYDSISLKKDVKLSIAVVRRCVLFS